MARIRVHASVTRSSAYEERTCSCARRPSSAHRPVRAMSAIASAIVDASGWTHLGS